MTYLWAKRSVYVSKLGKTIIVSALFRPKNLPYQKEVFSGKGLRLQAMAEGEKNLFLLL